MKALAFEEDVDQTRTTMTNYIFGNSTFFH